MLVPERAPQSVQFWIITIGVGLYLAVLGLVLLGVGRHLPAIGILARSMMNEEGTVVRRRWRALAAWMLLGGVMLVPVLLLMAWAIVARIGEGFPLLGQAVIGHGRNSPKSRG